MKPGSGPRKPLARVHLGSDPHAEKKEAKARAAITFERIAARYLKKAKARLRPRSYEEVERHLERHWAPLNPSPIHKIRRAHVAARLGEIAEEHGPFASNRARASLSAMFTWAMGEGLADTNPSWGPTRRPRKSRVTTSSPTPNSKPSGAPAETTTMAASSAFSCSRRNAAKRSAQWPMRELDLDNALWTIPKERTKNGLPHDVPLSAPALSILQRSPKRDGRSLVFGEGDGGFQGWSKAKAGLDKRIAASGMKVRPWRLHDLRRTAATRMGDLGVLPHVIEAVLNHVSGHRAGVAGIYNRATYANEKREALILWAAHVMSFLVCRHEGFRSAGIHRIGASRNAARGALVSRGNRNHTAPHSRRE